MYKKIAVALFIIAFGYLLAHTPRADAATQYGAGSYLQVGDVTTTHILNGTIKNEDVSATAAIDLTKLFAGGSAGNILFDSYGGLATSTGLSFATSTPKLTVTGALAVTASTTFNGVEYKWPSADGSANYSLTTNGAGVLSWASASPSRLLASYTAGAAISAGQAVTMATGTPLVLLTQATSNYHNTDAMSWGSVEFNSGSHTSLAKANVYIYNSGGSTACSGTAEVRADSGSDTPTGSALNAQTASWSGTCGASATTAFTASFSPALTLTANTTYHLVMQRQVGGTNFEHNATPTTGNNKSVDGTTWTASAGLIQIDIYYYDPKPGDAVVADAGGGTGGATGFVGIANNTVAKGGTVNVVVAGQATGLSGLTAGTNYYLSNTPGALSSSASSVSKKACVADSTTSCIVTNIW